MRNTQGAAPPSTDRARLAAARSGDREAFGRIYDDHVRPVYRYAFRIVRNTADAEDITQDAFALAWKKRDDLQILDTSMLPWLLVVTRNLSLARSRQRSRTTALLDDASDQARGPEASAIDRELARSIQDAVELLTPVDQELYRLCVVEELSYQQAAESLGATHGAVRNRLSRLRQALRSTLTPHTEGLR